MPEIIGLISGSGFADLWTGGDEADPCTPWGTASAAPVRVPLGPASMWVLPRHGVAGDIPAHRVNYRANIACLDALGVDAIIGLNTVGVISRRCAPGGLMVPSQLIDYTWGREQTFFDGAGEGLSHIEFTEPFTARLRQRLLAAAGRAGIACVDGGIYAVTQGPRLETAAEIDRLERDGADIVGMTAMPEAALAAERRIDYACLALAVNAAAGRGYGAIHDDVAANLDAVRAGAQALLQGFFGGEGDGPEPGCGANGAGNE